MLIVNSVRNSTNPAPLGRIFCNIDVLLMHLTSETNAYKNPHPVSDTRWGYARIIFLDPCRGGPPALGRDQCTPNFLRYLPLVLSSNQ